MTIDEIIEKTRTTDSDIFSRPFGYDKKREWLTLFRNIGYSDLELRKLSRSLQTDSSSLSSQYLSNLNEAITESYGKLIPKLRWLFYEYTPYPYSDEASARLMIECLEKGIEKYPKHGVVMRYTTKIRPGNLSFVELLIIKSFPLEDYGRINFVDGIMLLIKKKVVSVQFFEVIRAYDDYVELQLVLSYDSGLGKKFLKNSSDLKHQSIEHSIYYSSKDKTLKIDDHKLKLTGDMQANLCETLFKKGKPDKVWSNDEIFESWQWPENRIFDTDLKLKKENRLKIYQTGRDINQKVSIVTKGEFENIIGVNTKSAWIEESYRTFVS